MSGAKACEPFPVAYGVHIAIRIGRKRVEGVACLDNDNGCWDPAANEPWKELAEWLDPDLVKALEPLPEEKRCEYIDEIVAAARVELDLIGTEPIPPFAPGSVYRALWGSRLTVAVAAGGLLTLDPTTLHELYSQLAASERELKEEGCHPGFARLPKGWCKDCDQPSMRKDRPGPPDGGR